MSETIILPRNLVQKLFAHAQTDPALEVCGLISSRNGEPLRHYPVANVAGEPDHLFDMDQAGQVAAMKAMRERGEELFAIYHSHPSAPAEPSAQDRELLAYPDAVYLIISLNTKGVLELRAWRSADCGMAEVPLRIIED